MQLRRAMTTAFLVFGIDQALLADEIAYSIRPRTMTFAEVTGEKHGSVVNSESGQPMQGVTVIATWVWHNQTLHGIQSSCVLEIGASTDSDGRFTIPNVAKNIDRFFSAIGVRDKEGAAKSVRWNMIAFEPGFAEQPLLRLVNDPNFGDGVSIQTGADIEPLAEFAADGTVVVKPIALVRSHLSFTKQIGYLKGMRIAEQCSAEDWSPEYKRLRDSLANVADPLPCKEPASEILPARAVMNYTNVNFKKGASTARRLQKIAQEHAPFQSETTAGELCDASRSVL